MPSVVLLEAEAHRLREERDGGRHVTRTEELRAIAARARHFAENIVTDEGLARKLLNYADELDVEVQQLESSTAAQSAPKPSANGSHK